MMLLLFSSFVLAKELPGEELFVAPQEKPIEMQRPRGPEAVKTKKQESRNLPAEYVLASARQSNMSELVLPLKSASFELSAFKIGESLDVQVKHSVLAFSDEKSPVIAEGESGKTRNIKFIGSSRLERNSRRVFIDFSKVVVGEKIYEIEAIGVSAVGQPGIEGEYHSREAEYFSGDFVASFAAGYFDGLVPRHTNAFGLTESDQSVDSATKKGLAASALSTAERFREKLKRVPEFSEIKGPFQLKVLILSKAKSKND